MTAPEPAPARSEVDGLNEAEQHSLAVAVTEWGYTYPPPLFAAVERIVAARVEAAKAEALAGVRALAEGMEAHLEDAGEDALVRLDDAIVDLRAALRAIPTPAASHTSNEQDAWRAQQEAEAGLVEAAYLRGEVDALGRAALRADHTPTPDTAPGAQP